MYARRLRCRSLKIDSLLAQFGCSLKSYRGEFPYTCASQNNIYGNEILKVNLIRKFSSTTSPIRSGNISLLRTYNANFLGGSCKYYCSKGDGSNPSGGKHVPLRDNTSFDKVVIQKEEIVAQSKHNNEHAWFGEQDQLEWLDLEKFSIESKRKESPFLTKRQRFKNELLRRVIPWEKIKVSWDNFPYHMSEHTKNLLVDCAAAHLKHRSVASSYGARLPFSSGRILLQGVPGTELYRERMVRALAQDLQVPLLVLNSNVLAPYDFGQECTSEDESDDEHAESVGESTSESDSEDESNTSNEGWASSNEARSSGSGEEDDVHTSAKALKKILPCSLEEFTKTVSGEIDNASTSVESDATATSEQSKRPLQKGDRVKYVGAPVNSEVDNRSLSTGQRGEVYEINGDQVAVILDDPETRSYDCKNSEQEQDAKPSIYWIDIQDIVHDLDTQIEDWLMSMEALCEILPSLQPVIVYFPDCSRWLSRAVPRSSRKAFILKVEEMFDQLPGPLVMICGENVMETGPKEKDKITMVLPGFGRVAQLPLPLKRLRESLLPSKSSKGKDIFKLFNNSLYIHFPEEEEMLRIFNKQIEEDRRIIVSRSNLTELHKVLGENDMCCFNLLHVNTDGVVLTKREAEKVVGWARNHHLSSVTAPSMKGDKLMIPSESLETAIARLKEEDVIFRRPSQTIKPIAKDEFEKAFVHALVPAEEIGVRFDDIGALDDVKKTLNELVSLPMRRPELFSHGNLLRPCKGILLFGPPGTGKTLLAKALATESGANFLNVTSSSLTSKWFGDAEKLTRALFSFASRLTPVIIFIDEVDSLLGARGGAFEHEATRRIRNEFMAAWDGLKSKDSQRILILGATNRPFDLDDAVIRRLPRRIYVDLPAAENRKKILNVLLAQENIEPGFRFDELANATEGYSGSDLKNLCIAAAYMPVQELLSEENERGRSETMPPLRSLKLDDFIKAKTKVSASVAYDATSMNALREWNEKYGEGGSRRRSPFGFGGLALANSMRCGA